MKLPALLFACLLCTAACFSQTADDMVLGQGARMMVFHHEGISVWGNVNNEGALQTDSGAHILLFGQNYFNTIGGSQFGTNPGHGTYDFIQPRPAPYLNDVMQQVQGGNTAGSFPSINIQNHQGLFMSTPFDTLKVRDSLLFSADSGFLFTDLNLLDLGPDAVIRNYNEQRYVLMSTPFDRMRKDSLQGSYDFPVGRFAFDYTPARISNSGDPIALNVGSGSYADTTLLNFAVVNPDEGMGRIWVLDQTGPGNPDLLVDLQHNHSTGSGGPGTEGSLYDNSSAFVTRFIGFDNNTAGGALSTTQWDYVGAPNLQTGSTTGNITSGSPISNASELTRAHITDLSAYKIFTKALGDESPLPVTLLYFQGHCDGHEVAFNWKTAAESGLDYFELEASGDGLHWQPIGRATATNHANGYNYTAYDTSLQAAYYRLEVVGKDGHRNYSAVIPQPCTGSADESAILFPNPGTGLFYLKLELPQNGTVDLRITDELGRLARTAHYLLQEGQSLLPVDISPLPAGHYFIQLSTSRKQYAFPYIKLLD